MDEIEEAGFGLFMFSGGQRRQGFRAQVAVGGMVVWRQRLFQPGNIEFGHRGREPFHGFGGVAAVAHPPPGVGVDHQAELRTGGFAHQPHGFEVQFRAERGTHFVGLKAHLLRLFGFSRISFRCLVHTGASIQCDAVAHPAAE